jgi:hypothetical protein
MGRCWTAGWRRQESDESKTATEKKRGMAKKQLQSNHGSESSAEDGRECIIQWDGTIDPVVSRTALDEIYESEGPDRDAPDAELDLPYVTTLRDIKEMCRRERTAGIVGMLRYTWSGCKNPWEAMKRLLAITRKTRCDLIRGLSVRAVAKILHETPAATSAREIRVVEKYLIEWGVNGFLGTGGSKSPEARRKYAKAAMGNTNRSGREREEEDGAEEIEADDDVVPKHFPRRTDITKDDLKRLADEAERRRLAGLCVGVRAEEIVLNRTVAS